MPGRRRASRRPKRRKVKGEPIGNILVKAVKEAIKNGGIRRMAVDDQIMVANALAILQQWPDDVLPYRINEPEISSKDR